MSHLDKFDTIIRRRDDKVTAAVPQLGLYATASDVNSALDALERKKAALLQDLTAAGEIENLSAIAGPAAVADPASPAASQGLGQFALKLGIVFALAAIAVVVTTNLITTKIESTRLAWEMALKDYTGARFWSKVEKNLDQLAKSEMPEEKRQKILSDIRLIRDRWWPFIAEAAPADAKPK